MVAELSLGRAGSVLEVGGSSGRSSEVDVAAPPRDCGAEVVQLGERRLGANGIGCGEPERERFDQDEGGAVAGEQARRSTATRKNRADATSELVRNRVGDQDGGDAEFLAAVDDGAGPAVLAAVGENDDRVASSDGEELVGQLGAQTADDGAGPSEPRSRA